MIGGSLVDSEIYQVVNLNPEAPAVVLQSGKENIRNVVMKEITDIK